MTIRSISIASRKVFRPPKQHCRWGVFLVACMSCVEGCSTKESTPTRPMSLDSGEAETRESKRSGDRIASGPAVGSAAGAYHPLLCNGETVGQRWCMVCTNRDRGNDMVIIFAREVHESVVQLIKAVDDAASEENRLAGIATFLTTTGKTAREAERSQGSNVVFLDDKEKDLYARLRQLATETSLKRTSLNIYPTAGPEGYDLSQEAAVTVLLVDRSCVVHAKFSFSTAEKTEDETKTLIAAIHQFSNERGNL